MPNFDDKYSELLVESGGNLVPFLDSMFGFLYRRSDFFQVKSDGQVESVVGFHPGQNKTLLLSVMNKWETFAKGERDKNYKLSQAGVPIAINEEEVGPVSESLQPPPSKTKVSPPSKVEIENDLVNGANQGSYQWSQTVTDLEIIVPVDKLVVKGSQIQVGCTKNSIKVVSDGHVLVDGELSNQIKPADMIWNLMPGSHVLINLEKAKEGPLWSKLLQHEELRTNLNYDKPFTELKEDDKIAVEYAMTHQAQKEKEDKKLETLLKEAWDKDGSPFKGQPYDASVFSNT